MPPSPRRVFLLRLILLAGSLGASLLLGEILCRLLPPPAYTPGEMDPGLLAYDPNLGWRHQPNWSGAHSHPDFSARYATDARGFRRTPGSPPAGASLLVLGDSFTFGTGVNDSDTFSSLLASAAGRPVANAGTIGYSTDQEVLLLEQMARLRPVGPVVLVVYLGNDLLDNLYPFPVQAAQGKPWFEPAPGDTLELRNVPVPTRPKSLAETRDYTTEIVAGLHSPGPLFRLLSRSALFRRGHQAWQILFGDPPLAFGRRLDPQIERFRLLLLRAARTTPELTVVLIPGRSFVLEPRSFSAQYQEALRSALLALPLPSGLTLLDAALPMRQDPARASFFFPREGHFSPAGHRWLADFLLPYSPFSPPPLQP